MEREQITAENLNLALKESESHLIRTLERKGDGTFASTHEVLGVVTEEFHELVEAIEQNDVFKTKLELLDLATACVFAVACANQKTMDW